MVALNPILYEAIYRSEQELREQELNHRLAQRARNAEPHHNNKPGSGYDLSGLLARIGGWFASERTVAPSCDC